MLKRLGRICFPYCGTCISGGLNAVDGRVLWVFHEESRVMFVVPGDGV